MLRIGWDPHAQERHFVGVIDEVTIYDRALTPNEIEQNMNASLGITPVAPADKLSSTWDGPGVWRGNLAYNVIERLLKQPVGADSASLMSTAFGSIFVLRGTVLRLRFLWWPLHPIAYPLAGYHFFAHLWFPFLVSWLLKAPLLKYGGIRAYRKALPLFLGLILGDFVLGTMWGIMGLLTGEPAYTFKNW